MTSYMSHNSLNAYYSYNIWCLFRVKFYIIGSNDVAMAPPVGSGPVKSCSKAVCANWAIPKPVMEEGESVRHLKQEKPAPEVTPPRAPARQPAHPPERGFRHEAHSVPQELKALSVVTSLCCLKRGLPSNRPCRGDAGRWNCGLLISCQWRRDHGPLWRSNRVPLT